MADPNANRSGVRLQSGMFEANTRLPKVDGMGWPQADINAHKCPLPPEQPKPRSRDATPARTHRSTRVQPNGFHPTRFPEDGSVEVDEKEGNAWGLTSQSRIRSGGIPYPTEPPSGNPPSSNHSSPEGRTRSVTCDMLEEIYREAGLLDSPASTPPALSRAIFSQRHTADSSAESADSCLINLDDNRTRSRRWRRTNSEGVRRPSALRTRRANFLSGDYGELHTPPHMQERTPATVGADAFPRGGRSGELLLLQEQLVRVSGGFESLLSLLNSAGGGLHYNSSHSGGVGGFKFPAGGFGSKDELYEWCRWELLCSTPFVSLSDTRGECFTI